MHVQDNYLALIRSIGETARRCGRDPSEIALIVATKRHSLEEAMPAYLAGCRDFGESRIQEFLQKKVGAPQNLRWHFIGTLQSNKLKAAMGCFALIHAVHNADLLTQIAQYSSKLGIITSVLLQVNTSGEPTKHGLSPDQWRAQLSQIVQTPELTCGLCIKGLMTMAPLTEDATSIRQCFSRLRSFRDELAPLMGADFVHLSMGMSHDYQIAIEEGSTMLRLGTAVFQQ